MISNFDGITDNNKPSSKVLRPPGGGSSDIFGSDMPQTPRNVKNRMASNIFSAEKDSAVKNNVRQGAHRFYFIGDAPRRAQKNVDSYSRLFGEPTRPITPAKNHMKSNIPFGQSTEAAQQLLTNGNGHYNGKSGSVSSASSSVSSSTENLKMNGGSRSVFRNMSTTAPIVQESSRLERDPICPLTPIPSAEPIPPPDVLDIDLPCIDDTIGDVPEDNNIFTETGKRDVRLQTRRDSGTSPELPYSLDKMNSAPDLKEPLNPCPDYEKQEHVPCIKINKDKDANCSRNPITGLGLNGDGVGGLKPKKLKTREGNPVTGEGYKPGANDYQQPAPMNGANQVINKNRVPPGGYSSGLW
ncbi:microtubule-associated protein Jupiter isoform X2 [Scaptodrosophila lebanonensis]|uniref:Microtubule-associated protein Jupiter n=1 Tax=Drosophila lebanonensis TaxID=7225 RepID=A0A6J2TKX0_DROLE|nr:microtubule-associated protein Jupiter isoform X2 [Scaptodrosophila lebanonensis]